jgi:hypothetical protein
VCLLDPDRAEEGRNLVGVAACRVRAGRFVALAGAGEVDGDAAEVLGVCRELERVPVVEFATSSTPFVATIPLRLMPGAWSMSPPIGRNLAADGGGSAPSRVRGITTSCGKPESVT